MTDDIGHNWAECDDLRHFIKKMYTKLKKGIIMLLTKDQRIALKNVYYRHIGGRQDAPTYREFRRTVQLSFPAGDCVMVPVPSANLWLGIEKDGYTHS